ncbi:hypothetical protein B0H21DRAFT_751912 [Amylocystis lapponica]|nr:hypothetical protein B0H21DRAFT_751912 [Amylocystis lapponica]
MWALVCCLHTPMSSKRPRATSPYNFTLSPSPEAEPTPKAARTIPLPTDPTFSSAPLFCTLPPTCNPPHNHPTPLANTSELEAHYATHHAHVCEERGCGCVFPDAKLLELHQTECHDPVAAVRKERGEKIFACHQSSCPRSFLTPKTRRLHLIQAHGYPKEYFFAVTNKGVGGLLKRWGEGASMLRGQWKPREGGASVDDGSSGDESVDGEAQDSARAGMDSDGDGSGTAIQTQDSAKGKQPAKQDGNALNALADKLDALSLVPPAVRFGRGSKKGSFSHHRGGHGHEHGGGGGPSGMQHHKITEMHEVMPESTQSAVEAQETRALGASNPRGRGRVARGIPPPRAGAIRMGMNFSMARGRGGRAGMRGNMFSSSRA